MGALPEGRGCSDGLRPVEPVAHVDAEACPVSDGIDDLLPEMADAEHDAPGSVPGEQAELVEDERLTRHACERLWRRAAEVPEAGPEAAGEDRDRQQRRRPHRLALDPDCPGRRQAG